MFGVQKQNIERCNLSKQIISQPKLYIVRAQSTNLFQQEIVRLAAYSLQCRVLCEDQFEICLQAMLCLQG